MRLGVTTMRFHRIFAGFRAFRVAVYRAMCAVEIYDWTSRPYCRQPSEEVSHRLPLRFTLRSKGGLRRIPHDGLSTQNVTLPRLQGRYCLDERLV